MRVSGIFMPDTLWQYMDHCGKISKMRAENCVKNTYVI